MESDYPACSIQGADHQRWAGALTLCPPLCRLLLLLSIAAEEDVDGEATANPGTKPDRQERAVRPPRGTIQPQDTHTPPPAVKKPAVPADLMYEEQESPPKSSARC